MKAGHRISAILGLTVPLLCAAVIAQRNTMVPQPQAGRLAAIGPARPNRGALLTSPRTSCPMRRTDLR
jgi:hypothetical protein